MLNFIINLWHFAWLKRTKKSRQVLRNQFVVIDNRRMKAVFYLRELASKMPGMRIGQTPVDHLFRLNKLYFKYDLPGVIYYKRVMWQVAKKQMKQSQKTKRMNLKKQQNEKPVKN
ncbi:MAG: hypothetical protein HC896_00195 [Bacteroidales bacterium]|nr:hypothetical protein [Bacteroidales bacterium]